MKFIGGSNPRFKEKSLSNSPAPGSYDDKIAWTKPTFNLKYLGGLHPTLINLMN